LGSSLKRGVTSDCHVIENLKLLKWLLMFKYMNIEPKIVFIALISAFVMVATIIFLKDILAANNNYFQLFHLVNLPITVALLLKFMNHSGRGYFIGWIIGLLIMNFVGPDPSVPGFLYAFFGAIAVLLKRKPVQRSKYNQATFTS
jgi:hypothetical protein